MALIGEREVDTSNMNWGEVGKELLSAFQENGCQDAMIGLTEGEYTRYDMIAQSFGAREMLGLLAAIEQAFLEKQVEATISAVSSTDLDKKVFIYFLAEEPTL